MRGKNMMEDNASSRACAALLVCAHPYITWGVAAAAAGAGGERSKDDKRAVTKGRRRKKQVGMIVH